MQEVIGMDFFIKRKCSVCGFCCGLNRHRIKNKEWCCSKCFKKPVLQRLQQLKKCMIAISGK